MVKPGSDVWERRYHEGQIKRTIQTLNRLAGRIPASPGRLIPDPDHLPINDGKRIEATVMFLNICKFSSRPAESEAEQHLLMQVVALFFTEMIRIIEDYGGVVEKNTGDGLMAYFWSGPSTSGEKDDLAAALTMFGAAADLINPLLIKSRVPTLNFRICMDRGFITVANIGAARRFSGLVAVGTTANIASKMLDVAEANTIVIGARMRDRLPTEWLEWTRPRPAQTGWMYTASGHFGRAAADPDQVGAR